MDKIGELLYEQVYFFFLKIDSNDIVMSYINKGLNLIFNCDALFITKDCDLYIITVIKKRQKKYWKIYSNIKERNYYVLCDDGNLDEVFEYISQL
ncbi:MAG: hypothetical protein IJ094_03480 [Bacilli bacterium]|nr:hypothetical protein [Bacilli bacterium]